LLDGSIALEKNKIQNQQSFVTPRQSIHVVEIVEMDDEELYLFLMMSWKRQVPRGTKFCLKIKITLSERIGKIYIWMKTSEWKTVSK
jgi:hypothetical protein